MTRITHFYSTLPSVSFLLSWSFLNGTFIHLFKTTALMAKSLTLALLLGAPLFTSGQGWRQLFNGKDLAGWEQVGPGKFVVEDGKLKTMGGMGMIYYPAEKFGDVVIRAVYTVKDNDSNSGVFIRIPEKSADPWVAVNKGYEVQIDNEPEYQRLLAEFPLPGD